MSQVGSAGGTKILSFFFFFLLTNVIGRIPRDESKEARIYPLPHMYVVKDLVPDLTQFYKQYKAIKPYLLRETPTEDVSRALNDSVVWLIKRTGINGLCFF